MGAIEYFTDPVLRAPTIGSMLMCASSAIVGVIVTLKKRSLIGETLSHATYPGVVLSMIVFALFPSLNKNLLAIFVLLGAALSSVSALGLIDYLERKLKTPPDSALCFTLAIFFGLGITLASFAQNSFSSLYKQIQSYLYGQAATMTDKHIYIYLVLTCVTALIVIATLKEIRASIFDENFSKTCGIKTELINKLSFTLTVLAIVIGIRSVGLILMSGMLIIPAVAARQFTHKLFHVFVLAALIGIISAFLGVFLSNELSILLSTSHQHLSLPTGPMIILVAAAICVLSLLFAPEKGLVIRCVRITSFRFKCLQENILKSIWRVSLEKHVSFENILQYQNISPLYLKFLLRSLISQGWIKNCHKKCYCLSLDGRHKAERIVRLHRLWEVYLVEQLGFGHDRVHHNAEEMEHIITPEIEKRLLEIIEDATQDPHNQPIPNPGGALSW